MGMATLSLFHLQNDTINRMSERMPQKKFANKIDLSEFLNVFLLVILVVVLIWGIRYVSGVLTPLLVAFVIAITLRPCFDQIKRRGNAFAKNAFMVREGRIIPDAGNDELSRKPVLNLVVDIVYFLVTLLIPLGFGFLIFHFGSAVITEQFAHFGANIVTNFEVVREYLLGYLQRMNLDSDQIKAYIEQLKDSTQKEAWTAAAQNILAEIAPALMSKLGVTLTGIMGALGSGVFTLIVSLATWIVLPQFMFYMMSNRLDRGNVERAIGFFAEKGTDTSQRFTDNFLLFRDVLELYFQKQTLAVLMYIVVFFVALWVGFVFQNAPMALGLAVFFGLLNYFPNLGTVAFLVFGIVMLSLDKLAISTSLAVCAGGVFGYMIDEYVILKRPHFKKLNEHKVHSGIMIFFILFWGAALNGLLGMLLAAPLTLYFSIAADGKYGQSQPG